MPSFNAKSITGYIDNQYRNRFYPDRIEYSRWNDGNKLSRAYQDILPGNRLELQTLDRFDNVAGLYYLHDDYDGGVKSFFVNGLPFGSVPTGTGFIYLPDLILQTASSKAIFFDTTFRVTDRFRLLGGVRRTSDRKTGIQTTLSQGDLVFNGPCDNTRQPDLKYDSTTGKFGVQFDVTRVIMGLRELAERVQDRRLQLRGLRQPILA